MTAIKANGITIEYEETGPRDAPVILLIMGLGMQLVAWPESFVEGLAAAAFGSSASTIAMPGSRPACPRPDRLATTAMMARAVSRRCRVRPPYTLNDMARDTVGLMDALGIGQAHVVGVSMGGMIAQILAIEHPERVKSLTSIMSTTGDRRLPGPKAQGAARAATAAPARSRRSAVRRGMELFRLIGGVRLSADRCRAARQSRARGATQLSAGRLRASADRHPGRAEPRAELRRVRAPTLVLHGSDDPLVPKAGGEDTAANIPGARLRIVPGMGHFLPEALVPLLVDEIAGHCLEAEDAAQSRVA